MINKKQTEKAYLTVFNFMHKASFNLVDGIAKHKQFKKAKTDMSWFIYNIIRICINRLRFDGYCNHVIKDILQDALKHEIQHEIKELKDEAKSINLKVGK